MAGPAAHGPTLPWVPGSADIDNGAAITMGVKLTVDASTDIGGVSFYVPTTDTGTYSWGIWEATSDDDPVGSGTGTLLDSDSQAATGADGGTWLDVALPMTLVTGKVYVVGVHRSSGRYPRTTDAFNGQGISGNGVNLLQAGADPNPPGLGGHVNGLFTEGAALALPVSAFQFADYGIDVWLAEEADDVTITGAISADARVVAGAVALEITAAGVVVADERTLAAVLALPISLTGAISAPERTVDGRITVPVTEAPPSWEPLRDMLRTARRRAGNLVRATACPRCGEPLEQARGVLHCRWDGWTG